MSHEQSIADVIDRRSRLAVLCARVEEVEPLLPSGCASLMPVDGPYHRQKGDAWDNEHKTATDFLRWKAERYAEWQRILAPNGTIYDFASPAMGARTEVAMREHFEVLCNIRWAKPFGRGEACSKEALRSPFPQSETIIMAEQRGGNAQAMDQSGYNTQCEAAKREVFGDYIRAEMSRAGVGAKEIAALFPSKTGGVTGCVSNWLLGLNVPTPEQYETIAARLGPGYLKVSYESLRLQYESLRRPFCISADVPYTDVWTYDTVRTYEGKHPCEKPRAMAADMVRASSRVDDIVIVFFAGSGIFAAEALSQGRRVIAVEADPYWAERTRRACEAAIEHGVADMKRIARTTPKNEPSPTGQSAFSW